MAVNIGDVIRVTANFLLNAVDPYVNTFHFEWIGLGGISDDAAMDEIAISIDAAYILINAELSNKLDYVDIQGQNITQNVLLPTKLWPTLVDGLSASGLLPPQTCGYVFYRTTRPKTRASVYLPGFVEDASDIQGAPDPDAIIAMQAFGDFVKDGLQVVLLNLKYGAYNRPLDRFTEVNAAVVSSKWRTQRRRVRGVEL